jgi:hypothetical protein
MLASHVLIKHVCGHSNIKTTQATLSFMEDTVAVYGGVSFDHDDFTITADGQSRRLNSASGHVRMYHPWMRLLSCLLGEVRLPIAGRTFL